MAVVSTDKSILQTLEVFDIFFTRKGKLFGILDKWSLMGGGIAYERWSNLAVQLYLGCFYLFFCIIFHYCLD